MLIEYIFRKLYGNYVFPFERSTSKIARMKEAERTEYYLSAKRIIDEPAYNQEMQECIRKFYQELAIKTDNKIDQAAYRLTLKFAQELDKRFKTLASLYAPPKLSKPFNGLN